MKYLRLGKKIVYTIAMQRTQGIAVAVFSTAMMTFQTIVSSQQAGPAPDQSGAFKAGIDLVRISAVVRDRKGRFADALKPGDFEVLENGRQREITGFRQDTSSVSVALLFDISGSMEARMSEAREAATSLLGWLTAPGDEAAIFTFDTRLEEVQAFTAGRFRLPGQLSAIRPFGATSLHDAIARTAERVAARESLRRAVIVFTDGLDTASRLTASEVSGIASAIDVPVYIVGVVSSIDNPKADVAATSVERSALTGSLGNLAYWTGGEAFVVSTVDDRSATARRIVDELRHLYLIAFEASGATGWHPLLVRMRDSNLTVRARSGYFAGGPRSISH